MNAPAPPPPAAPAAPPRPIAWEDPTVTSGFEATVRVVCYAQTAQLAHAIPMCGGLLGVVWGLVLYIVGIAAGQRTTHGKAALAVLLPGIICCVLSTFMFIAIMGMIAAQAR